VGREAVHGGPVEHLVGTRARTVLRVRRNVIGVLPIFTNTSAHSLVSGDGDIRVFIWTLVVAALRLADEQQRTSNRVGHTVE
jgi:hypothetical protein